MIYIITPFIEDFKRTCRDYGLPTHLTNPEVIWINHPEQLFGRKIFSNDEIIKGDQYYCFDPRLSHAIEMEIELRTEKKKR